MTTTRARAVQHAADVLIEKHKPDEAVRVATSRAEYYNTRSNRSKVFWLAVAAAIAERTVIAPK